MAAGGDAGAHDGEGGLPAADELAALLREEEALCGGFDAAAAEADRERVLREVRDFEREVTEWRRAPAAHSRGTAISASLIAARCCDLSGASEEDRIEAILSVKQLRLDSCDIERIENLECMTQVTHCFLQHNRIHAIEELEVLPNLAVLILSHNQIEAVENLTELSELRVLDLSHNRITRAHPSEFPPSLRYLSLEGNPVAEREEHREELIRALPQLVELDSQKVTAAERDLVGAPPLDGDGDGAEEDGGEEDGGAGTEEEAAEDAAGVDSPPAARGGDADLAAYRESVDAMRHKLLADYLSSSSDRARELERVLGCAVEGPEEQQLNRAVARERAEREERRRLRSALPAAAGAEAADELGSELQGITAAGRRAVMAADLQSAAEHQSRVGAAQWEQAFTEGRQQLRDRRAEIRQRSRQRQEDLLQQGDSAAFAAAEKELQQMAARGAAAPAARKASGPRCPAPLPKQPP
eukprot:TRINITY_DN60579_c0_g1_i1.p2 TRINITY_DN60579_c0_g1~~TRINITY_DN60579_c0_g1_i1.p2  ORF type:complete len:502 (+),score=208.52 TRINITY_DN60579_c0_g1_i1:95-1507(+)